MCEKFTKNDFIIYNWTDYEKLLLKISNEIIDQLETRSIAIDCIVPIMRGGGIPAISLSHCLGIKYIYPVQLGHIYKRNVSPEIKVYNNSIEQISKEVKLVLIVEGYHASGTSAYMVYDMIKAHVPTAQICYVTLGRDISYSKDNRDFIFSINGFYSNECRNLTPAELKYFGVTNKITLFPWEDMNEEIVINNNSMNIF